VSGRFAVRSARIVTPGGVVDGAVVVRGEHVEAVVDAQAIADGALAGVGALEDVGGLALLPGLVDCHVHLNEPGRTEWEGFDTATRAAASGGVTAVVDMPLNCIPVTTTVRAFEEKLAVTSGQLHVDTGFWGGVVPGNARELAGLARAGVLGAKAFLCHSGIDDFPNATEEDLREAMPRLRDAGIPLLAHAELDLGGPACAAGARAHGAWLASRPRAWEDAAIALLVRLCRETRCPVHVVHLSSASAVPILRDAKAEGLPITVETCPHYLCITSEQIPDGATEFKCAPPIRDAANREELWAALLEGVIDFVISDHSPCTPGLKRLDAGGFGEAWGGIASLSLGLSSVWTEARGRGATLERMVEWMSRAPAQFAGLGARKGAILPGMHADLVAFDPDARFTVAPDMLRYRHPITPYMGRELEGTIHATWLRGEKIFDGTDVRPALGEPLLGRDRGRRSTSSTSGRAE
jgi:allantoinase